MEEDNLKLIGNYEVVAKLREVPEGVLYSAFDRSTEKPVIIKIYFPGLVWSEDILDDFFNRISYLRFIEHEYLLPIIDVGKLDELPYAVFPGDSFTALTEQHPTTQNLPELLDFFYKIAEVLDFLHKQEILHGNLNADNIFIDSEGAPRLFDYGLSGVFKKLLLENIEDGFDNLALADVKSTSPEQILGRTPTRQTDIYAFGLVFYFCIFGEYPFTGQTIPEAALAQLDRRLRRVNRPQAGQLPGRVLAFIQKCLQVESENRFKSFAELLAVLDRLQRGQWVQFSFAPRFKLAARIHSPRNMSLYLGAIILLGVGLFIGFQFYGSVPAKDQPVASTANAFAQTPTLTPIRQIQNNSTASFSATPTAPIDVTHRASIETPTGPRPYKPAFEQEPPTFSNQVITIANLTKLHETARLGYGKPEDADISPDGAYFAVASSAGVFIFKGMELFGWIDPQDWATSVKFSSKGDLLAIGVQSGAIQLWDWQNEIMNATLIGHKGKITRLIFSNNDRLLYSASYDQHVRVWDLNSKNAIKDFAAHSSRVNDIAVTSDGRTLVSCSDDQLIRVWDVASKNKIQEIRFVGKPKALAISPDNAFFAVGGDSGFIYQRKLVDYELRNDPIPVYDRIWNLQYVDNNTLFAGIGYGDSNTFNANSQEHPGVSYFEIKPPPSRLIDVYGPSFDFDSFSVFYAGTVISLNWDGRVTIGAREVLSPTYDNLDRLDFSMDGTILASGGKRGTTNVWRLTNNAPLLKEPYILPFGDPIAPDGSAMVVITTETKFVAGVNLAQDIYHLINLITQKKLRDFSETVPNSIVGYARNGSSFISESLTQSKTWDYATGYETYFNGLPQGGCWMTRSANDNEFLMAYSTVGMLSTWETWSAKICAWSFQQARSLSAISINSRFVAYLNAEGVLEGFDPLQNKMIWKIKPDGKITALAVAPDGTLVATGNEAGKMIFINSGNGETITEITGNFGALQAIEFSEDGTKIATTGYDGVTRVFGVIAGK